LEATYAVHLRLIGMLVADFLLVITELSSLGVSYGFVTVHAFDGQIDGRSDGFTITKTALHTVWRGKNPT